MAGEGGFQFEMMPQDYSYVNPGGVGQSFDWSQPSFASMPDMGGFQSYQGSQTPSMGSYNPFPSAVQADSPYSGGGPAGPGTTQPQQQFGPSTGQATGSAGAQNAKSNDDDWKKMLMKMGMGAGVGLIGEAGKSLFSGMNQPKPQQSQPLPQAPSSAIPQAAPLVPLPGTQASPLISGMPQSVQQSTGLMTQDRMRRGGSTGGLQLY